VDIDGISMNAKILNYISGQLWKNEHPWDDPSPIPVILQQIP